MPRPAPRLLPLLLLLLGLSAAGPVTRHYKFEVGLQKVTRLCRTKTIVSVNGRFPGPRVAAREGDRLLIKVTNHVPNNISIHWHGIRQLRTGWADGPAYITQCPIQTNQSYVYNFSTVGQRGTLFWHAHISWLRATVYGPLLIFPASDRHYPFPRPHREVPLLFGEWWNADPEAVIARAMVTGAGPAVSDSFTFNGLPGFLYNCSSDHTFKMKVEPGKTYLLRLINAALNDELFFGVANHTLTVVEVDAGYTKPVETTTVVIAPGQTTNVLLRAERGRPPGAAFLMSVRPYATGSGTFDSTTSAGILEYACRGRPGRRVPPFRPTLPPLNDTPSVADFTRRLRSMAADDVPRRVDRGFLFTVGLGTTPCPAELTCQGPTDRTRFSASMNNFTFHMPTAASLLQSRGGYTADFPGNPEPPFDYTGPPPNNTNVDGGTRAVVLAYGTRVELVLQDTSILGAESHPLHLHGFNFFVLAQGFGNFDPQNDPREYNLVDPVQRNTVGVPSGGWVAIRFLADNPGVWLMHCHLETHTSWGLKMVWVVLDGEEADKKLLPPPTDLPKC